MDILKKVIRGFGVLSAFLFMLAAFVIVYETVSRYLGHPTSWGQDFAVYFMIAGAFLCQGAVMLDDGHVRVDFFIHQMGPRISEIAVRVTLAIALVYIAAMTWQGAEMALHSYETGKLSTGLFRAHMWIPEASIPLGFGLLFIAAVIRVLQPKIATMSEEIEENLQL
jgi:C4-dicarboxylate transporter DctQ subunit